MAHGDAGVGKWRGNWRMEWVASTLHTTSERGVSSITTADAHTSAASSRLNWRPPADLNGLIRFAERRSLVSARVITFQTQSTRVSCVNSFIYQLIFHVRFISSILRVPITHNPPQQGWPTLTHRAATRFVRTRPSAALVNTYIENGGRAGGVLN